MQQNQWDILSSFFDVRITKEEIEGGAMDNILIAWPPIINFINEYFSGRKSLKALDYGCGVGELCYQLYNMGFDVIGIDTSSEMIKKARDFLLGKIITIVGNEDKIPTKAKFDLITSVQVFQFVDDIYKLIHKLDYHLIDEGIIIFATFSLKFVRNCIRDNVLLVDFDSNENPRKGNFVLGKNISIPVFIRTEEEYIHIFKEMGYKLVLKSYPEFTSEFLNKYPLRVSETQFAPSDCPEFMILGFQKNKTK